MRYASQKLGGFSMRLLPEVIERIPNVRAIIDLLHPSAVIVDDLDRMEHPERILSQIEEVRHHAKVLMVSVNKVKKLDAALIRPGRFDGYEHIEKLDEEVVDRLIGEDVPEAVAAKLRELPIAYIDAFKVRREVKGLESALASVEDLVSRRELVLEMMKEEDKKSDDEGSDEPKEAPTTG